MPSDKNNDNEGRDDHYDHYDHCDTDGTNSDKSFELDAAISKASEIVESLLGINEVKIYELSDAIVGQIEFSWDEDPYVSLYQKLFITQASLCRLSQKLDASGNEFFVEVTPIGAKLQKAHVVPAVDSASHPLNSRSDTSVSTTLNRPNELFFLNSDNFFGITADDVQKLLSQFWLSYERFENQEDALLVLGLKVENGVSPTWHEIQKAYRKKAAQNHPDKSGSTHKFIEIRAAYDQLKHLFAP